MCVCETPNVNLFALNKVKRIKFESDLRKLSGGVLW